MFHHGYAEHIAGGVCAGTACRHAGRRLPMQSCRLAGLLAPCRTEHTRWLRGLGSAASTQVLPGNRNKRACMHVSRQVSTLTSSSATGWIPPSSQHFSALPACLPRYCSAMQPTISGQNCQHLHAYRNMHACMHPCIHVCCRHTFNNCV